jgi:hypothetical protein
MRTAFTTDSRLILLEQDADNFEAVIESFKEDIKAIKALLVGVMVSALTATVVGAINLLAGRFAS